MKTSSFSLRVMRRVSRCFIIYAFSLFLVFLPILHPSSAIRWLACRRERVFQNVRFDREIYRVRIDSGSCYLLLKISNIYIYYSDLGEKIRRNIFGFLFFLFFRLILVDIYIYIRCLSRIYNVELRGTKRSFYPDLATLFNFETVR